MKKTFAAIFASICAVFVHGYLLVHHYQIKFGASAGGGACRVSEKINCDITAASSYSEVLGIPVALLGALTHLVIAFLLLISISPLTSNDGNLKRTATGLSLFAAIFSLFMAFISVFVIKAYCPFCTAAYILSIFIALMLTIEYGRSLVESGAETVQSLIGPQKWIVVIVALILPLGYLFNRMFSDQYNADELKLVAQESVAHWKVGVSQTFDLENGLSFGNIQNPKMVIVEFADYLCPHCKFARPTLHSFTAAHPDARLVFKNFPLDGQCNPSIQLKGSGVRCHLAYLST